MFQFLACPRKVVSTRMVKKWVVTEKNAYLSFERLNKNKHLHKLYSMSSNSENST